MILIIDNNEFQHFVSYNVSLKYNSFAHAFSFLGLKKFLNNILSYQTAQIYGINDELLITGTIVNSDNKISDKPTLSSVSGYSTAGILEDCEMPIELYPLETTGLSLLQVTDRILKKFGIKYLVDPAVAKSMNKKYDKLIAGESESIKNFLNKLAANRDIFITSLPDGTLYFTKVSIKKLKPVFRFEEANSNIIDMSFPVDGQALHSSITVLRQASTDNPDSGQYTITNPFVSKYRPTIKILQTGDIFDIKTSAKHMLSAELAQLKLVINTNKFINVGQLITVNAPSLGIKKDVNFFVEECEIKGTNIGETYTLTAVMAMVYDIDNVYNIFA